jgi:EmrB/QacA subfamily drug resistance transporter
MTGEDRGKDTSSSTLQDKDDPDGGAPMSAGVISRTRAAAGERPGLGRAAIVAALGVGIYLAALDISVVNAILPVVAEAFGTDLSAIEWVVTIYLLVQSALLLMVGRLGDLWGHKKLYLLGLGIFVLSSAVCGLATSTPFLVAGRAIQAIGASMIFTNLAVIMLRVFPPEQRGRAVGIQATIVYVGLATGAPLGGWLTDALGWQSVFLVNVPVGLIALLLGLRVTPADEPAARREPFDLAGAAVYVLGLGLLLLGLNQGHAWGWTSAAVVGCLLLGAALLAGWVRIELRAPSPMIDLSLFRRRAFSAPTVSAFLNYMAVSSTFLLPFALIQGRGLSPAQVGLILTCQPIIMALTASISGSLSDRVGSRAPATLGMLILSLGLFLLSRQDASTPIALIVMALLLIGLGIGLFTSPNSSAILGAVPAERRGVANGVLGTVRTLGMVLGIGVAGAVYATTLGLTGDAGADGILRAADTGLLIGAGVALLGAATSATRPGLDAGDDA